MAGYVNYEYYSHQVANPVSAADFQRYINAAETAVDVLTNRRAATAKGFKAEAVKKAVCAAINASSELAAATAATQSGAISSVSNDGFTVTYGNFTANYSSSGGGAVPPQLYDAIAFQLSGTGLMSYV